MNYLTRLTVSTMLGIALLPSRGRAAPCVPVDNLLSAMACVRKHEPAYLSAARSDEEASELESSAYRLINPELELGYADGANLGNVEREKSASLLFTFELGGKRSARAKTLGGEGLELKADAFEQQIHTLTEFGAAVLRLDQIASEKQVVEEAIGTFRKVIRLYRSRGSLPPEQRVSLDTFELVLLGYESKRVELEASELRYRRRVEALFGPNARGAAFRIEQWRFDPEGYRGGFDRWVENAPEMLRARAAQLRADGQADLATAELWPDLRIGPTLAQVTEGPSNYNLYSIRASFSLPLLNWNLAERRSRAITARRAQARLPWNRTDVRSQYEALMNRVERLGILLKEAPGDADIQRRHRSTESLYQRGMIGGALMIEAHRSMVENYETKHALQLEYLKGILTLEHLERASR